MLKSKSIKLASNIETENKDKSMRDTIAYMHFASGKNKGFWIILGWDKLPTHVRKDRGWRPENIFHTREGHILSSEVGLGYQYRYAQDMLNAEANCHDVPDADVNKLRDVLKSKNWI